MKGIRFAVVANQGSTGTNQTRYQRCCRIGLVAITLAAWPLLAGLHAPSWDAARAEEQPAATTAPAAASKPGPNDRQITLAVRSYLEREHFTRRSIDDEIAHRWFKIFLESLDPMKIYFIQSDIDAFMQKRDSLDDLCLLYTSPSPRDRTRSRMPSSA